MAITPHTNLYLIKCPLEEDNLNQLTFSNRSSQLTYFSNLPHLTVDNFTYQRKDNIIRYPEHIDNILNYNYVMYQNENYSNKWFFAFITNMRYINDGMTEITIKTDVYQTWQFDLQFKQSFIEREHTNDDSIGSNTIPENLETGDYIVNNIHNDSVSTNKVIVLATTRDPSINESGELIGGSVAGGTYGGVSAGYKLYTFNPSRNTFKNVLKAFANAGANEQIVAVYMIPRIMIVPDLTIDIDNYAVPDFSTPLNLGFEFSKQTTLDGYSPINNKLKCYPYNYIYMTNNNGSSAIYNYEYFSNNLCEFIINAIPTPSGSTILYPMNYKKTQFNYSEGIQGGKYPICGWANDTYTNWLTQNAININSNVINSGLAIGEGAGNLASGNPGGFSQIQSGINGITNTISSIYQHKLAPIQASGNLNVGDVNYAINITKFSAYKMSIKQQFARIIDDYFSMYGYKTNRVKLPNLSGRRNWNYVKTIGANIEGNIPQTDIEELKSIFNNGVTLWHNPSTYLDYSQNNGIV